MAVSIDSSGDMPNEAGPKTNPREVEFFSYQVPHTIDTGTCIQGWSLGGDIPVGVSIDGGGLVSGVVAGMWEQPSCNPKKEKVFAKLDGRDSDLSGRFAPPVYEFAFTVTVDWKEQDTAPTPPVDCEIPGSTTESYVITLVKDFDGDAILFARNYLDGGADDTNEGYHCEFTEPDSMSVCSLIGGEWSTENETCSIPHPLSQGICESLGGEWTAETSKCDFTVTANEAQCEAIGGTWTKNVFVLNGVEYDNSVDYIGGLGLTSKQAFLGI